MPRHPSFPGYPSPPVLAFNPPLPPVLRTVFLGCFSGFVKLCAGAVQTLFHLGAGLNGVCLDSSSCGAIRCYLGLSTGAEAD